MQINHLPLTALPEGLIRPVSAISLLVAHVLHADALPTAALKSGRALTVGFCGGTNSGETFSTYRPGVDTDGVAGESHR